MLLLNAKVLVSNELTGALVTFTVAIVADPELIVGALSLLAIPVKVYEFALV